jgi:phytol kinase
VHLGGGLVCLFFPFLVESPWVVLAMAVAMSALFAGAARFGGLRSLHGVERRSRGAEYYPLAIFLVFLLARGRPFLYVSAVLVLAAADAFAALVGSRYGVVRYEVEEETKSLEGSLVFFLVAFLAIHLPTLLLTDLERAVCVLGAVLVAALVTGFEAISLRGADNLFVPLGVAVVLGKITSKPLSEVVFQNLSLLAICLLVAWIVRRERSFNVGGTIAFILFAYGAWSLGNWQWALPAFLGFGLYVAARRLAAARHATGVKVRTVARALLAPFLLLLIANAAQAARALYGPYLGASATVLAMALAAGALRLDRLAGPVRTLAAASTGFLAVAFTGLVPWLAQETPLSAFAGLGAVVVCATVANDLRERRREPGAERPWGATRFLLALAAAALVLLAQRLGWLPPWDPSSKAWR